ncbi:1-deoxy-D-xylulose-5-phosphate synthase [Turneriella parva]|uniref:1-deoxy-D-xylulose-5-phosphate synthase n=1 Tax=Turneriella parva (strain ATCC BAA-1111 / DSM 21527 / NCTC 11395 / H) TaxID=869212 RepID=I4B6N1_TURPD|nr:1-deoxy-D-xylulose-5-phosphate synthase [Turneriella parva]AFM12938.1 1-deoxy-D-xylulose-5-phosphate synthase [Turneriella parva DSM 21527]
MSSARTERADFAAIESPEALRRLPIAELPAFCNYLRAFVLQSVSASGGHLSSNLGSIELTVALHYVFDSPHDRFMWDVGHQCYAHKILTGRKHLMDTIRKTGGLSGFPKRSESKHDLYNTGHAGTAISQAMGEAVAARLQAKPGEKIPTAVAIVGDASIVTGMAFEAMNHVGYERTPMLVVLNDNEMSISKNVGAISYHLTKLINTRLYRKSKRGFVNLMAKIPLIGKVINRLAKRFRMSMKSLATDHQFFGELGFRYLGPIDGHDVVRTVHVLQSLPPIEEPILLHVVTKKGYGYPLAEKDPILYHGVSVFDPNAGIEKKPATKWGLSKFVGETLAQLAAAERKLVVITPAMKEGSGLGPFAEAFPERFFDAGIAEQHATTFAGALASAGLKPYLCIYSTFLQRGYDQLVQDIALMNLPVRLIIDRAGCVGQDGETHQGFYDIAFMAALPHMRILSARDAGELVRMLAYLTHDSKGPIAVRFPKKEFAPFDLKAAIKAARAKNYNPFNAEKLAAGSQVLILSEGVFAEKALAAREILANAKISAEVVDVRSVHPLPMAQILRSLKGKKLLATLENHGVTGGLADLVSKQLREHGVQIRHEAFAFPDEVVPHGTIADIEKACGLTPEAIAARIRRSLKASRR